MKIEIDEQSKSPLYMQIANQIVKNISLGHLQSDEKIPSINNLSKNISVARETVEKAYNFLKNKEVIIGKKGKGTYVNSFNQNDKPNFFIGFQLKSKLDNQNKEISRELSLSEFQRKAITYDDTNEKQFLNLVKEQLKSQDYLIVLSINQTH